MAAPTANFPDVQEIRENSRKELAQLLDSYSGNKDLVLDPTLMRPLDRIAGASLLKSHGVDKIFKLESSQKSLSGCNQRIYLVRPKMNIMKYIADHINIEKQKGESRKYKIIMVPRRLHVCERILEQEGVYGNATLEEFQLDFIPLDRDILSLEMPELFRSFFLDGDQTWLHTVSRSLTNIQGLMGRIPNVYGIGKASKMVYELMNTLLGPDNSKPDMSHCDVGHLILIDRDNDFVTPLCSQVTYEGLLDDTFGIHSGFVEFGPEISGKSQPVKLILSSQDQIFEEIRNRHFSNVFGFLSSKAKDLQALEAKRHQISSVGDMKTFVANELKELQQNKGLLAYHIGACEAISKKAKGEFVEYLQTEQSILEGADTKGSILHIEELINKQYHMVQTLKLLCLLSLTNDGIDAREYKSLKTQFLHSHGFEHMLTFFNLKKLGILIDQDLSSTPLSKKAPVFTRRASFKALRKKLNLIPKDPAEINLKSPNDMAYVFSGAYCPLSCKLVEMILQRESFAGLEDVTRNLTGVAFSDVKLKSSVKGKPDPSVTEKPAYRCVLVYFLGGCTYSEINALRFLGRQKGYRFLIGTTAIITGNSLLECLIEKSPV